MSHDDRDEEMAESQSEFEPLDDSNSENWSPEDEKYRTRQYNEHMLKGSFMATERNPRLYLGLLPESVFAFKLITENSGLSIVNIYVVLKKLRMDNPFSILAAGFGSSIATLSRMFTKTLPILSNSLKGLIVWPKAIEMSVHLPIPFRTRYAKVVSIIDCFEIEIEKSSHCWIAD